MTAETVRSGRKKEGTYVRLPVPLGDPDAFRYGATADILQILVDNPEQEFTNRELHRVTGNGLSGVNAAVDSLEALGVIDVDRSGRANAVRMDSGMLIKADDPVTTIPQSEYHEPVRAILADIEQRIADDVGIILFGSVARGTADRTSDIDLFVVIDGERMKAQREAHTIEQDIADMQFDGDRYEAHIVVEPEETAANHDRIDDIFTEGLTLRDSSALDAVKREVFGGGAE
ncbi:nucleotidyltransferase domain-containing protein [Natronomonas salsuginis]|uniref:Nucleotidyltransferase domain-containing protein n=1 Tax=Natronomonas salsuginis TaxID=2217661 RepID=A0A4U5JAF8_9EURY|nr:nucleotidyltransferase domain-containing protein [Natronomonas salsuginis]TKR25525.1 nucleotidyltransferase domain-containing protein [Natronomonas salsuginis]